MKRREIAPGVHITAVPGEKFKRGKIAVHFVLPSQRDSATEMALIPHVLDRRCEQIPDSLQLSRFLYSLYGADISSESYSAGPARIASFGISGLKNEFALQGEDLTAQYTDVLCNIMFHPLLEDGAFSEEDVEIEKEKQSDFLKSEMNDKRGYCMRQARRKLYKDSPLGIESAGYLEDMDNITPKSLYTQWKNMLRCAQIEILVCGVSEEAVAQRITKELAEHERVPCEIPNVELPQKRSKAEHYEEPMATTQGKLNIICTSGEKADGRKEVTLRLASALYGGLPTSRLFMNVREKQSLCYYCASSYGFFSGTLSMDSGVDHQNTTRTIEAILKELEEMKKTLVSDQELQAAQKYMDSMFTSAKDSPDALLNFAFTEWLKGTNRTLDDMISMVKQVTAEEIRKALTEFAPAVEYVIVNEEDA